MLYGCLCVSAVLHGLAMFSLPSFRPASRPDDARVLTALFEPSSPAPVTSAPRRPRERNAEVPAPPLPKPLEPAPATDPRAAEPAATTEPPAPPSPVAAAPQSPAEAPARIPESVDPSMFDAYRLALINAAKRYKRYPVQAMERGWEGRVEIRLVVDANGADQERAGENVEPVPGARRSGPGDGEKGVQRPGAGAAGAARARVHGRCPGGLRAPDRLTRLPEVPIPERGARRRSDGSSKPCACPRCAPRRPAWARG